MIFNRSRAALVTALLVSFGVVLLLILDWASRPPDEWRRDTRDQRESLSDSPRLPGPKVPPGRDSRPSPNEDRRQQSGTAPASEEPLYGVARGSVAAAEDRTPLPQLEFRVADGPERPQKIWTHAVVESDGSFYLLRLPPGECTVSVRCPGRVSASRTVTIPARGVADVGSILLSKTAEVCVTGLPTYVDGSPEFALSVSEADALPWSSKSAGRLPGDGSCRIRDLWPGDWRIRFTRLDPKGVLRWQDWFVRVKSGDSRECDLDVGSYISGHLVFPEDTNVEKHGIPILVVPGKVTLGVTGQMAHLGLKSIDGAWATHTDERGCFEVFGLGEGDFTIWTPFGEERVLLPRSARLDWAHRLRIVRVQARGRTFDTRARYSVILLGQAGVGGTLGGSRSHNAREILESITAITGVKAASTTSISLPVWGADRLIATLTGGGAVGSVIIDEGSEADISNRDHAAECVLDEVANVRVRLRRTGQSGGLWVLSESQDGTIVDLAGVHSGSNEVSVAASRGASVIACVSLEGSILARQSVVTGESAMDIEVSLQLPDEGK